MYSLRHSLACLLFLTATYDLRKNISEEKNGDKWAKKQKRMVSDCLDEYVPNQLSNFEVQLKKKLGATRQYYHIKLFLPGPARTVGSCWVQQVLQYK